MPAFYVMELFYLKPRFPFKRRRRRSSSLQCWCQLKRFISALMCNAVWIFQLCSETGAFPGIFNNQNICAFLSNFQTGVNPSTALSERCVTDNSVLLNSVLLELELYVLGLGQVHATVKKQVTVRNFLKVFLCKVQYVHVNPARLGGKSLQMSHF